MEVILSVGAGFKMKVWSLMAGASVRFRAALCRLLVKIGVIAVHQLGAMENVATYFAKALACRIYQLYPQPNPNNTCFTDQLQMHFYESSVRADTDRASALATLAGVAQIQIARTPMPRQQESRRYRSRQCPRHINRSYANTDRPNDMLRQLPHDSLSPRVVTFWNLFATHRSRLPHVQSTYAHLQPIVRTSVHCLRALMARRVPGSATKRLTCVRARETHASSSSNSPRSTMALGNH